MIVVGGGFGGIAAAKELSKSHHEVLIIDRTNHHLFQPLLYQVATAALSPGDIATPIRGIFSGKDNIKVMMGEVSAVDKERSEVELSDGRRLPFDYMVMAPGARYNYFGNDHWQEHATALKSISNALDIRERILISLEKADQFPRAEDRRSYLTYVVIGGGPTGVEMAGAIAEIAKRNMMRDFRHIDPGETHVILVEAMDQLLNAYPRDLADHAKSDLEKMGVDVRLNSPVEEITHEGVKLPDGFVATPNVIWAAGVAASPLLQTLDMETDKTGRVKVNKDASLPGYENIFVIGDAACLEDENGDPLPALAPVALQMGKHAGRIIKKEIPAGQRPAFRYIDKGTMATIGRAKAVANVKGIKVKGLIAWMLWSLIHVFYLIGFRNRFRVMAEWMWNYITFKRGVRLITGRKDPELEKESDKLSEDLV